MVCQHPDGRLTIYAVPRHSERVQHDLVRLSALRFACRTGAARSIRELAGIRQTELAEALGVDDSTVARWESGERTPRAAVGHRYAELLEQLEGAVARLPVSA